MLKLQTTEIHTPTRPRNLASRFWGHLLSTGLLAALLSPTDSRAEPAEQAADRHQAVLALNPVGYWPTDEGGGDVLHDHSDNSNHGQLHRVPWDADNKLLDFTGAYQWVDIPNHPSYQSPAFSIGGWVFTRKAIVGGQHPGREGMTFIGNAYHRSGYTLHTLYDEPVLYGKSSWRVRGGTEEGISLCLRRDELVDVISGSRPDALGTRGDKVAIAVGEWQHVLYTYDSWVPLEGGKAWLNMQDADGIRGDSGTARLYLNGELVKEVQEVPFKPADKRFMIGSDAVWWLQANQSGSLNGSIRDLVMFSRALDPTEVANLARITQPAVNPTPWVEASKPADEPEGAARATALPRMTSIVRDADRPREERVNALLEIADMKAVAASAAPALAEMLEELVEREGAHLPRIDDLLRNALIRALLDIAPEDERVRRVLGMVFAKPVLDTLNLQRPEFATIRPLVEENLYMDALDAYRRLELNELERRFFSQGAPQRDARAWQPNPRAYTGATTHNGHIYKVGVGEAWKGVEKIAPEDFEAVVARVSEQYPEAATWRDSNDPHLYRVPITRIDPEGNEETVYLEGQDFIIGTGDEKYRGWSIALDTDGYIHVTGGMHNAANPAAYIPGSWEKMGASYDYRHDDYPIIMYWVSQAPGDITSLEFMGQRANPRAMPVPLGMNYMNFIQDRNGTLYLYGRIHVQGIQSWGLYRYDVEARQWHGVGGFAPDVKNEFPEWTDEYIQFASDWLALPTVRWRHDHPNNIVLAWARQPHFYNYIRGWGIKFDPANRMHVRGSLFGLDEEYQNEDRQLYAWSDDGGRTFHRADGTPVELPLTVNPGAGNVDVANHSTDRYWNLWISLLRDAGYTFVRW